MRHDLAKFLIQLGLRLMRGHFLVVLSDGDTYDCSGFFYWATKEEMHELKEDMRPKYLLNSPSRKIRF